MTDFEIGLHRALLKAEIEYRARYGGRGDNEVTFLDGSSPQALARDLRGLGFRIAEVMDEFDSAGVGMCWVVTTSGIIAYAWPSSDARYVLLAVIR